MKGFVDLAGKAAPGAVAAANKMITSPASGEWSLLSSYRQIRRLSYEDLFNLATAGKIAPDVLAGAREVISYLASGIRSSRVTQKGTTSAAFEAVLSSQATGGQAAYDIVSVMEREGMLSSLALDFSETVSGGGSSEAALVSYLRHCGFNEAALFSHRTGGQAAYYNGPGMEEMLPFLARRTSVSGFSKSVVSSGFSKAACFSHRTGGKASPGVAQEILDSIDWSPIPGTRGLPSQATGGLAADDISSVMERMLPSMARTSTFDFSKNVSSSGFGKAARFSHRTGRKVLVTYGHQSSVRFLSSAAELATRQAEGKATPATAAAVRETTSRGIFMKVNASFGVEFADGATRAQAPCTVPKSQSRWNGWPLQFGVSIPITVTIMVCYKIGDADKESMTVEGQENLQGPEVAQLTAPVEVQRRVKTTRPPTDSAEDKNEEETRTNNATDSCVKKPKLLQALGGILPPKYKADEGKSRV